MKRRGLRNAIVLLVYISLYVFCVGLITMIVMKVSHQTIKIENKGN